MAYLDDGTLTGSTISMAAGVRNLQTLVGLPTAIDMATVTPARALGIDSYAARGIGGRADLVALDRSTLEVVAVWLEGEPAYARPLMPAVALFVTCVVDQLAPEVGISAVRLLEAAGVTVAFPEAQTCCGQPAGNVGEPEAATRLARHFLDVFEPFDAVVAPSGSCVAMVHHWYERLLTGRDAAAGARDLAAKTYELTSFLVDEVGVEDVGSARRRHGHRARRVSRPAEPRGPRTRRGRLLADRGRHDRRDRRGRDLLRLRWHVLGRAR